MGQRVRRSGQISGRPAPPERGALIGGRYEFQGELGGGGMAVVYEVVDRTRARRLALKRLRLHAREQREQRARALFELEYHTLAELRHPRIVDVYDYGFDDLGPFYTMELLEGGDLRQNAPVAPKRLCRIAADVCSALSMLHSRRLLHRDVSPRNVRCTHDGTAKLIDFGVMTHVGPSKELVGTPAYAAPELVNLQLLDARTDLFALGATLYFALTGRHAYPARDFGGLPHSWRNAVARPSELVSNIPDALDALVLDLLQLDPKNRPRSAAEVMDRLGALYPRTDLNVGDVGRVEAQAYLSTPAFVGRVPELGRLRSKLQRALDGRGSATLVEAGPGVGRSRFLDAVVLAGKLQGMTVLRAYADKSERGDYRAARALLLQLQCALPEATSALVRAQLPILGQVVPELLDAGELADATEPGLRSYDGPSSLRSQMQQALRQLLLGVSAQSPLLIAIDDLPMLDEPSTAALALLAREVNDAAISLVATAPTGYSGKGDSAYRLYAALSSRVALHPLSPEQVRELLASVFGDASHIDDLVRQLIQRTHGNPRDLLRMTQHLVDRGIVRYDAGAWSVPARIDPNDLPSSLAQVLRENVSSLPASARVLAGTFALCPFHSFSFDECQKLQGYDAPGPLVHELGQLVTQEVLGSTGERYALTDRAYVPVLLTLLSKAETETAHARLAHVLRTRGDDSFRVAQHLLRAGQREQAFDAFVAHAIESQALTDREPEAFRKYLRSLPEDWLTTYEEVLQLGQELHRPQTQLYALRSRLAGIVAVIGLRSTGHVSALLTQLADVVGLPAYETLDPALAPEERLAQMLEAAEARYRATPEHEQICDPQSAIQALARNVVTALGMFAPLLDAAGLRALPSLAPLALQDPAHALVTQLCEGVYARLTGRMDRALRLYKDVLQRTAQPDRGGLDPSHHRFTRASVMSVIGLLEASMGLASSLDWADRIESDPLFQVTALQVRVLYRLWQGDCLQAEREQREADTRRIESGARQNQESTYLLWQVIAHAGMEDLTRLRRSVDVLKRVGKDFPGWRPVISYATAEYQRARGDLRRALVELQDTLATVGAGEHQIWSSLATAHVRALDDARKSEQAVELGRRYCAQAEQVEIGFTALYIELPLAVAEAKQGLAEAVPRAERVIERFRSLGTTGLSLALAYEARIRVAIARGDRTAYLQFVERYEQDCLTKGGEALAAKLHRLRREAQRKALIVAPTTEPIPQTIKSKLLTCSGAAERAHVMLAVLAASCGASEGFLYLSSPDGPIWVASVGARAAPPEALDRLAREYMAEQSQADLDVTADDCPDEESVEWRTLGEASYQPVLLSHYSDAGVYVVTGLLVLLVAPDKKLVRSDFATQMSRVAAEIGDCTPISAVGADEAD